MTDALYGRHLYVFVGAEADYVAPSNLLPGQRRILTDGGVRVEQQTDGTNWDTISTGGAATSSGGVLNQSDGPTTVAAAGSTVIGTYAVAGHKTLGVEIAVATQALDGFTISGRFHASGSYHTLFSTAGEFTNPTGLLVGTSGDLTAIAAAASGWLLLDVDGLESVRLSCSAAADSAAVTTYALVT